jgi:hypothetical protein
VAADDPRIPTEEEIVPDDAGDAYVAHSTPELGTARNRRLLLFGVVPILAVVVGIGIWIAVSH